MREQSAQSWSFLALPAAPIERALFAGRVRCEMTAVSRQSKPAILTAGKGVGGRANANCERGDLDQAGGRGIDGRRPKTWPIGES